MFYRKGRTVKTVIINFVLSNLVPVIITGIVTALAGVGLFWKIMQSLRETGEALITICDAAEDRKITKEEWGVIRKEAWDIVLPWRKTPEKYLNGKK